MATRGGVGGGGVKGGANIRWRETLGGEDHHRAVNKRV